MLDNVNLIHMNGRVYDPNLGRFLSVDPVFAFPTNTQTLNPYTYVLNNPLSMTDPTGYVGDCPPGNATCPSSPQSSGLTPGQTASITIKTTSTPIGSHIAQSTTTTLTGVVQKDGSVAVYESSSSQNGGSNSQSATTMQNKPVDTAGINSSAQIGKISGDNNGNSQQRTVAPCEQGDCREPDKSTNNVRYKMVIDTSETEYHGTFSSFHYKLQNIKGKTLTGSGYSLEEHLWKNKAHTIHKSIGKSSEGHFRPLINGEFIDDVGYSHDDPSFHTFSLYQTFTLRYPGGPQSGISLPTEFKHITTVDKMGPRNSYTNNVIDVTPNN
jgi:RHS repeat-associated protein